MGREGRGIGKGGRGDQEGVEWRGEKGESARGGEMWVEGG